VVGMLKKEWPRRTDKSRSNAKRINRYY